MIGSRFAKLCFPRTYVQVSSSLLVIHGRKIAALTSFEPGGGRGLWQQAPWPWHFGGRVKERWLGPESNRGHEDFQSSALPTELPSQKKRDG